MKLQTLAASAVAIATLVAISSTAHCQPNTSVTLRPSITLLPPVEGLNLPGIPDGLKHHIEEIYEGHEGGIVSYRYLGYFVQVGAPEYTRIRQYCSKVVVLKGGTSVALAGRVCRNG